jgi:RNA polymerase sigma-70 factor (ECF subfamily)
MIRENPDRTSSQVRRGKSGDSFPATQWSLVVCAARPLESQARAALEDLCGRYWYPLYVYARRHVRGPEEAQDLIQEFFAHLLEKRALAAADPDRGRFRAFLLTALRNFLAHERDKARALKRGGGRCAIPLDLAKGESRYAEHYAMHYDIEPADHLTPERMFERQWALAVLERVMERLEEEQSAAGRERQFHALKGLLSGQSPRQAIAGAARELCLTPEAARQALHRLRKRYRALLRDEIAQTVTHPGQVEDELRALRAALE